MKTRKHFYNFIIFLTVGCGVFIALPAYSASSNSQLANVNAQIKRAEAEQKTVDKKVKESEKNVEKTKKELVSTASRVSKLESERAAIRRAIADLESRAEKLTNSIANNHDRLNNAAAGLLAISNGVSFDTDNARDYVLTSSLLTGMSDQFDAEIQTARDQIKELEKITAEKREQQEKLDATAKKYNAQATELDKLLKTRTAQNEKLKGQQADVQKRLKELSARAKNLSELSVGVGSSKLSADAKFSTRKLKSPVPGRLVVRFGEKSALGLISDGWRIRTASNALVTAPADGIVKFSGPFRGYKHVVILSHKNGYNSVMTGLGASDVLINQDVLAGEPIGRMSNDKPEMYLEIRRGASAVDPGRLFLEPK